MEVTLNWLTQSVDCIGAPMNLFGRLTVWIRQVSCALIGKSLALRHD